MPFGSLESSASPGEFLPIGGPSAEYGQGLNGMPKPYGSPEHVGPGAYGPAMNGIPGAYGSPENGPAMDGKGGAYGLPGMNDRPGAYGPAINERPGAYGPAENGGPGMYGPAMDGIPGAYGPVMNERPGSHRGIYGNRPRRPGAWSSELGSPMNPDLIGKGEAIAGLQPDGSGIPIGAGLDYGQYGRPLSGDLAGPPGSAGEFAAMDGHPLDSLGPGLIAGGAAAALAAGYKPARKNPHRPKGKGNYAPGGLSGPMGPGEFGGEMHGADMYGPVMPGGYEGVGYGPLPADFDMWYPPYVKLPRRKNRGKKNRNKDPMQATGNGFGPDPELGGKRTIGSGKGPKVGGPEKELAEGSVGVWVGPKGIGDKPGLKTNIKFV